MGKVVSIPLDPLMLEMWDKQNFTQMEIMSILEILVMLWRSNEHLYDVTAEFIRSELDLVPVEAEMFILQTSFYLMPIAEQVRFAAIHYGLVRWVVMDYAILLELDHEFK